MTKTSNLIAKWVFGPMAICLVIVLQACSGGGSASSSAGSTSQVASGVVTGFGSVFVDGVEL